MRVCVVFKTQWNLAPTEDPDEGTSSEREAVTDFHCEPELVFACLQVHMLPHTYGTCPTARERRTSQ